MKWNLNTILFLVVLLSLVYCGRATKDGNGGVTSIKPLETFTLVEDIRDYVDSLAFIELSGGNDALLASVNKVFIDSENNFIVWDYAAGIKVFASDGNFLRNIGAKGRGPGEYININDMCLTIDGQYLYVLEIGSVLKYKISNGVFINKTPIPQKNFDAICPSVNDRFYLFASNPVNEADFENTFYAVTLFDEEGTLVEEILPRKDYVLGRGIFTRSFDGSTIMRPQEGDNLVYKISDKPKPILRIDFGKKAMPAMYVFNNGNDLFEGIKSFITSAYFKLPIYFQDTENQLFFSAIGPQAKQIDFLYNYANNRGIWWENKNNDGDPIYLMASDREYFYAVVNRETSFETTLGTSPETTLGTSLDTTLGTSLKTVQRRDNSTLKNFLLNNMPSATSDSSNTYIAKIKFSALLRTGI